MQEHRHLPINSFKKDVCGSRISDACNLVRPCLMLNITMQFKCDKYEVPSFLTQEEWKSSGESKLTKICQNEKKLNGARGPVMRRHSMMDYAVEL